MEKISPSRSVASVFHPSSRRDHLLDHSRTHTLCTNCGRANRSSRGCFFPHKQSMVGTPLASTFTLSRLPSRSTALSTRSCTSISSSTMSGSAIPGMTSRGSASREASPERKAPSGATRHTSSLSSFSRLDLGHRVRCMFTMCTRPRGHANQLPSRVNFQASLPTGRYMHPLPRALRGLGCVASGHRPLLALQRSVERSVCDKPKCHCDDKPRRFLNTRGARVTTVCVAVHNRLQIYKCCAQELVCVTLDVRAQERLDTLLNMLI